MISFDIKLFILLELGLIFDWWVQTSWESKNKFTYWPARLLHSFIYTILSIGLLIPFGYNKELWFVYAILLITHFYIDKRTLIKWWMVNIKQIPEDKVVSDFWWMCIKMDQQAHTVVNFVIAILVGMKVI